MQIRNLDAPLGAEVLGVDFSKPVSAETFAPIRQAFVDRGVLLVRDQQLTPEQLIALGRNFGPDEPYSSTLGEFLMPGHPEIIVLSNIVENGKAAGVNGGGQYWHTDRSYVRQPAWSSVLYSREIPHDEHGAPLGDTEFASTIAAYDALPPDLKAFVDSHWAWHQYVFRFSATNDSMPGVKHPIALPHPVSGRKCLYVNRGFTHHIMDVSAAENEAMLERLYAFQAEPRFVYRHKWRVGDVLMWDNYSTIHNAIPNYGPEHRRLMWRTTIKGFELEHMRAA